MANCVLGYLFSADLETRCTSDGGRQRPEARKAKSRSLENSRHDAQTSTID